MVSAETIYSGMKSSQRSMNAFFDGFVHCTTPLSEFVDQYDAAINDRRGKEEKEDYTCMTSKPNFEEMYPIEAHAGQVYTRSVLKKFMDEFKLLFHCQHKKIRRDGDNVIYEVTFDFKGKVVAHTVNVIISDCKFMCTCARFENMGLLCKHILYLMKQKFFLKTIPDKYILSRWTLRARYTTCDLDNIQGDQCESSREVVSAVEAWKFRTFINQVYERAVQHRDLITIASNGLQEIVKKNDVIDAERRNPTTEPSRMIASAIQPTSQASQTSQVDIMSHITVKDSNKCKTKGRPKIASRIHSGIEDAQNQVQVKQRLCKICSGTGHDARNCPNKYNQYCSLFLSCSIITRVVSSAGQLFRNLQNQILVEQRVRRKLVHTWAANQVI